MIWLAAPVAFFVGMIGTRAVRRYAPKLGLVDAPDGVRKFQSKPIPLGGGVAVFFAVVMGTITALSLDAGALDDFLQRPRAWGSFLGAAFVLMVVGLLDDWYELIARYKLLGQIVACCVLVLGGDFEIRFVSVFGFRTELDTLAEPLTVIFLLFAINSLNLLDGMDGLLGTVGGVVCLSMAGVAYLTGQHLPAAIALATAGALAGFLRYNLPPASIYLGDCGSMLVGLIVGTLCIAASVKSHAVATLVPICVLILPFLDTTAAVIRRKLSGRSMAHADREHLHHVLLRKGLSVRTALGVVALAGLLAGAGAVASVYFVNELIGLSVSLGIVVILVGTGLFGRHEFHLMRTRATDVVTRRPRRPGDTALLAALPAGSAPAAAPAASEASNTTVSPPAVADA